MTLQVTRIHPRLPIFSVISKEQSIVYVPGHARRISPAGLDALRTKFASNEVEVLIADDDLATTLEVLGQRAIDQWRQLAEAPFVPKCLTLYLNNRCNLACAYCFAADERNAAPDEIIREDVVRRAADTVAAHCAEAGRPLTVVFHGGGEPTLHWSTLQRLVSSTRDAAARQRTGWWGYIATNGVLSIQKAEWLADHFDRVGLSCDGPPEIQDRQRPLAAGGGGTADIVIRTARLLASKGVPFDVRATITPNSMARQPEIAQFIAQVLGARSIRFEPVYGLAGGRHADFVPDDAPAFAQAFLRAQMVAMDFGADLQLSGVRPTEIHGPYCNPLRQVLQLGPDGSASACFAASSQSVAADRGVMMRSPSTTLTWVDQRHTTTRKVRAGATHTPKQCWDCVNVYHCARDCPERCLVSNENHANRSEGFRCRVNKLVALDWICKHASETVVDG